MKVRDTQILPLTPSADHTDKEGYAVTLSGGEAALVSAVTDSVYGIILEGFATTGKDSIATPGYAGTFKAKLASSPGTVANGTRLQVAADGTFEEYDGTAGPAILQALESGSGDELIEAAFVQAGGVAAGTTLAGSASGADLTVSGQVHDAAGNALEGRFIVGVFFGEAANDGTPFDAGDLAAGSGSVIVKEHTADAYAEILTKADGTWSAVLTAGSDDTIHTNAFVVGKVSVASTAVDVP